LGEEETAKLILRANMPRQFANYELEELYKRFEQIEKGGMG
jgi:hypothetical protein